jgi:hypothetical protein
MPRARIKTLSLAPEMSVEDALDVLVVRFAEIIHRSSGTLNQRTLAKLLSVVSSHCRSKNRGPCSSCANVLAARRLLYLTYRNDRQALRQCFRVWAYAARLPWPFRFSQDEVFNHLTYALSRAEPARIGRKNDRDEETTTTSSPATTIPDAIPCAANTPLGLSMGLSCQEHEDTDDYILKSPQPGPLVPSAFEAAGPFDDILACDPESPHEFPDPLASQWY